MARKRRPSNGTRHRLRDGLKCSKDENGSILLAGKIICHSVHELGIAAEALISSLSHTSRRKLLILDRKVGVLYTLTGSFFPSQPGANMVTGIAAVSINTVLIHGQ